MARVGGNARIPSVRAAVEETVGQEAAGVDPERAVARGAAVEGAVIDGRIDRESLSASPSGSGRTSDESRSASGASTVDSPVSAASTAEEPSPTDSSGEGQSEEDEDGEEASSVGETTPPTQEEKVEQSPEASSAEVKEAFREYMRADTDDRWGTRISNETLYYLSRCAEYLGTGLMWSSFTLMPFGTIVFGLLGTMTAVVFLGGMPGCAGASFLSFWVSYQIETHLFDQEGKTAEARITNVTVTSYYGQRKYVTAYYRFETDEGKAVEETARGHAFPSMPVEGETVKVRYLPDHPHVHALNNDSRDGNAFGVILGITLLTIGIYFSFFSV